MSKPDIIIGHNVFRTKESAAQFIRSLIGRYEDNVPLEKRDHNFMLELFKRHPRYDQKSRCGIAHVFVRSASPYKGRALWIRRTDGTETDISWKECLSPAPSRNKVLRALRTAINDQVASYKANWFRDYPRRKCEMTGEVITAEDCHVDHAPPFTFIALADRFLRERSIRPEDVAFREYTDGDLGTFFADDNLTRAWQEFHREHASLRCVSPRANLEVSRPDSDAEDATAFRLSAGDDAVPPKRDPAHPRALALASARIPLATLRGTAEPVRWATEIRARLLSEARRARDSEALILMRAVADPNWFLKHVSTPLERVPWSTITFSMIESRWVDSDPTGGITDPSPRHKREDP